MKMVFRLFSVLLVALSMMSFAGDARANLFNNAGFESLLEYSDPSLPNWFAFFGAGSQGTFSTADPGFTGTPMPLSGAHNLSIENDGTPSGFSGVFQRVPVAAGSDYTFSFEAKDNSPGGSFLIGAEFRIEWFDGGLAPLGATPNIPIAASLTTSYQPFSLTATAPAGAAIGQPVIAVETFSASGNTGILNVDNASFVVPEPGTVTLAGLGVVALLGARRRK